LGRTNTFDVASNAKLTLSGSVADGAAIGGLTKSGAGALILIGSNTYTGTTTVGAGSLIVNGTNSGPGVLNVAVGATLGGSGRIAGDTTISGNLQPGNSAGLLAFDGGLTLNSTAVTTMEIDGAGLRGTAYDAVNVEGLLTYGGDLILSFGTTFSAGSYSFDLFDFGSTDGSFDSVQLGGLYSGLFDDLGAGVWGRTSGNDTWTFSQGGGVLALEVVPEPSTYALLVLAAAGLGANVLRRRCSRW
jgi:autotransporter-associated beta strand protein